MAEKSAFDLLSTIRDQAIDLASDSAAYSKQSAGVKNIAYVINGVNFYCEAKDVKEISTCDSLTVVPQTKQWMRGLVNSKGVLYSVTDMSLFAGFDRAIQESRGHLLLLDDPDRQSALLVNRVIGFRYFDDSNKKSIDSSEELPDGLSPFVSEAFKAEDEMWYRLDVEKLLISEQFREVQ